MSPTLQRGTTAPSVSAALPAVMTGRVLLPEALQTGMEQAARQAAVTWRTARVSITVALCCGSSSWTRCLLPAAERHIQGVGLLTTAPRWQSLALTLLL